MQTEVGAFGGEATTAEIDVPPLMTENTGSTISSLNCPPFIAVELCREDMKLTAMFGGVRILEKPLKTLKPGGEVYKMVVDTRREGECSSFSRRFPASYTWCIWR
ncbi:hypothetical protein HanXRQr2_Chr15g0706431 [Helianthus annuus]|uniref:Uncharacterized protein n=1 Tax=Helianthus annuus TaxID=4232 RepID=A0A251SBH4_HELAN|nr:hypothetical protein HanXRQr2_Chr15g0706431 [Helianthus annuus]KAJ0832370.1 hypothetical protein HanPSC8_Chr15g0678021 [Helianthus annuus]